MSFKMSLNVYHIVFMLLLIQNAYVFVCLNYFLLLEFFWKFFKSCIKGAWFIEDTNEQP